MLFRRGNDADRKQTILASGEPGWCLDTNRLWIGDGVTPGGYPALSAVEHHLQYEPKGLSAPQALNINIAGLTRTLTDQWGSGKSDQELYDTAGKYMFPANQDLKSYYDFHFMDESKPGLIKHMSKTSGTSLQIDCLEGSSINIGDGAIVISKSANGQKTVKMELDGAVFDAAKVVFDDNIHTHFEDKTVDMNVVYIDPNASDPQPEPPGTTESSSDDAGLYFAHNNYLSAGFMRIGTGANELNACSVIELSPTVYKHNYDLDLNIKTSRGYVELDENGDRYLVDRESSTASWKGGGVRNGGTTENPRKAPKHVRIHSPRPFGSDTDSKGYDGYANLVLEAGLISFGPGDPSTGDFNAYKINQSVDTHSHPVFKGLTIQDGAAPITVGSGGTGTDTLEGSGVIYTPQNSDKGPLKSLVLSSGDFVVGSSTGVRKTRLTDASTNYIEITSDSTTGQQTIKSLFCPDHFKAADRVDYVNKWYTIRGDSGTCIPGKNKEELAFDSVASTDGKTLLKTTAVNQSGTGAGRVELKHVSSTETDTLYDLRHKNESEFIYVDKFTDLIDTSENGSTTDNTSPTDSINTGLAVGAVKINSTGHIEDIRSKDFDTRYSKLLNMGSNTRKSSRVNAPGDIILNEDKDFNMPGNPNRDYFDNVTIPDSTGGVMSSVAAVAFNDYGTVNQMTTINLNDYYLTKDQVAHALASIAAGIDGSRSLINGLSLRIDALEDEVLDGADKINIYRADHTNDFYPITFSLDEIDNDNPASRLGIDILTPKRLMYNPDKGALTVGSGTITAGSFTGSGENLKNVNPAIHEVPSVPNGDESWPILFTDVNGEQDTRKIYTKGETLSWNPYGNRLTLPQLEALDLLYTGGDLYMNNGKMIVANGPGGYNNTLTCLRLTHTTGAVTNHHPGTNDGKPVFQHQFFCLGDDNNSNYELYVNGYGRFRNNLLVDGNIRSKKDIIGFTTSDESLKDNKKCIEGALDKTKQINGYEFDWNDKQDTYTGHDVGVIAQEVEKVVPEVVDTREDGTKAVKYDKLVPLLIESIKELTAKVEKLESQIK